MIRLTPTQELALVLVVAVVGTLAVGLLAQDWLARQRPHGWIRAANRLTNTQRELRAIVEQHEAHLAHLAGELERVRDQVARRPPSDPTVRLGVHPARTSRLAALDPERIDPNWRNPNRSN